MQAAEQQRHETSYPLQAPTNPFITKDNGLPIPISPRLEKRAPRSPTPTPAPSSTSPAAVPRSTLLDSMSTRYPPPLNPLDTHGLLSALPPLITDSPIDRACAASRDRSIKCDGISLCYNCSSARLSCTYTDISQNKPPLEESQSPFISPEQGDMTEHIKLTGVKVGSSYPDPLWFSTWE